MPSYQEIIQLAIREVEIDVHGVKLRVVQRLMKDPKPYQEARAKLGEGIATLEGLIQKQKDLGTGAAKKTALGKKSEDEAFLADIEGLAAQWRLQMDGNERNLIIRRFCASVASVDLTDDQGKPLKIEPQSLFDSPIPNELFEEILKALDKEPLIPKGN